MNWYFMGVHYEGHTGVLRVGRVWRSSTRKQRQTRRAQRAKQSADVRTRVTKGTKTRPGVTGLVPAAPRGQRIVLTEDGWVDAADLTPEAVAQAKKAHRERASRCNQPTADGTPCQRRGTCPPGYHSRKGVTL